MSIKIYKKIVYSIYSADTLSAVRFLTQKNSFLLIHNLYSMPPKSNPDDTTETYIYLCRTLNWTRTVQVHSRTDPDRILSINENFQVGLSVQDFDASKYQILWELIAWILEYTSSDTWNLDWVKPADKHWNRSIVWLLRPAIRSIDPNFHNDKSTPKWVSDIMSSPILFSNAENSIRERLYEILKVNDIITLSR